MTLRKRLIAAVVTLLVAEMAKRGWSLSSAEAGDSYTCRTTERAIRVVQVYDGHIWLNFSKGEEINGVKFATDGHRAPEEFFSDWTYSSTRDGVAFDRICKRVMRLVEKSKLSFAVRP
jgi:hypothetical protein